MLRTSRFFPEEDDDPAAREAYADDNAKANEYLFRRVAIEDVVDAHLLATERAPAIGFGKYIISATTPFLPADCALLRRDAPPTATSGTQRPLECWDPFSLPWPSEAATWMMSSDGWTPRKRMRCSNLLEATGVEPALHVARSLFGKEERQRSSIYTTVETILEPFAGLVSSPRSFQVRPDLG